jgi:hypothetical protein
MTWYGVEGQRKVTNHGVNGDLRELACRAIFKMPPKGPSDELEADLFFQNIEAEAKLHSMGHFVGQI